MKEIKVIEKRASSKSERDSLAAGYTWYVNTLEEQKGIAGAKVHASKAVLSIKYMDQYIIYYK